MRRISVFVAALVALACAPALPASASGEQWSARSDGGLLADDIAQHMGVSLTTYNNPETVFVTGAAAKPASAGQVGVNDLDVLTTAYDAATGAEQWKARFDDDLSDDQAVALEVNYNNNLVYVPVNAGADIVTAEYAISSGDEVSRWRYAGGSAADSAISQAGGFMGVVGSRGSDFLVLSYATGMGVVEMEDRPVAGRAHSADISHTGSLNTIRTLLVTGQSSGFGTGGDLYTAAYNYRTHTKLWERSWASPNNRVDRGLLTESAHVSALAKGVGFIAGTTYTPERGFDIIVTAYDLATGASLWSGDAGMRSFDGQVSKDDLPVAMAYNDRTGTLYVTGTSERGVPYGEDVVTLAFDAVTGTRERVAYARGDSANADDAPTGLSVSADGSRVYVAADVHNLLVAGGRQRALFAYDADLHPAGSRVVGGSGVDRSAGVAVGLDPSRVFVAGSSQSAPTGYDLTAESHATAGFVVQPVGTALAFTGPTPTGGDHTDDVAVAARLTESTGEPVAGQPVTLSLAGDTRTATTDANGVASATFTLSAAPGTYDLTAAFAGADPFTGSSASQPFEVRPEQSAMALAIATTKSSRTLTATLTDGDAPGGPVTGRTVTFSADGVLLGTATTDAAGNAVLVVTNRYRKGAHVYEARFAGDSHFLASTATATTT